MRARNVKPSLFANELLGTADMSLTLLFIGLWCLCDREGRLEDRPLRIRAQIFPYRNLDVEPMLCELERLGFISRYRVDEIGVIEVVNFRKHQHPHPNENPSRLPNREKVVSTQQKERTAQADPLLLITDVRNSDVLIPDSKSLPQTSFEGPQLAGPPTDTQIEKLYQLYPRKVGKEEAKRAIRKAVETVRKGDCDHQCMLTLEALDFLADRVRLFAESTRTQDRKFIPHPATWFHDGRYWDNPEEWSITSTPPKTRLELETEKFDRAMAAREEEAAF